MTPRPPFWARCVLLATLGLVGCQDTPVTPAPDIDLDVSFEISTAWTDLFDPSAVDRVRGSAVEVGTGELLGTFEAAWDPTTDSWSIDVEVTPSAGDRATILVEVELTGGPDVQWSGRAGPIEVARSTAATPVQVSLFRGPLANLTVTGVTITGAPGMLDEGATAQLAAAVTNTDPSVLATVRVSWSSTDETVATVDDTGLVTGALPGTVSILAVAGSEGDTVAFSVDVVPASVVLDPPTARLTSLTEQIQLQGAVVDARGDTLSGYTVAWESTDSTVLQPLGAGLYEAVAGGDAEAVVMVTGVPGAEGRAAVEVSQEVATAALSADTVALGALGATQALTFTAQDAAGNPIGSLDAEWSSSDLAVATVDAAGLVTAVSNGSADVTARVSAAALAAQGWAAPVGAPALAPGMDTVSVTAAVEIQQIADSIEISPADSVLINPGSTVQYTASARDANGNPIVGAVFNWNTTDGGVATVDGTGLASTLGQGITTISAELDGVVAGADLTVLTGGGFTRVWLGGDAAGARDWTNQDNWLPAFVPTLADTAIVPISAIEQPQLTSDWSIASLVVENGVSLDLAGFTLTVTEDLDAGNTIGGPGAIRLLGSGSTVSGSLPNLVVNADVVVSGSLSVTGDLFVSGPGSDLDVGAGSVNVTDELRILDGATLTMQDPAGTVSVDGEVVFDGTSTDGLLTAGELRSAGNFTAWTSDPLNYAPSGSHTTVLDGTVIQTVYLHHNAPGEARFQALEIDNPGGVILQSAVRVTNDLVLTSGTLTGAQTMVIGGNLTEVLGGNQYRVLNTTFTGAPTLPASLQTNLMVTGSFAFAQDVSLIGNIMVTGAGATLDIGANAIDITGDFRTENGGTLTMQDPAAVLDIGGEIEFNGGATLGLLTDGELRVAGNFTAWTSGTLNFAPTGSHRTVMNGSAAQSVYLHNAGPGQTRFQDLEIDNAAGVTLLSTTRVTNDVVMTSGTLTGTQTAVVGGGITEAIGGNQYQVTNTTFTGSPSLPASLQTNALFTGSHAFTQDLAVVGDLRADGSGATLDVGANTVTVTGQLRIEGDATLTMQDAGGVLDVEGEAFFDGASTLGLLTAGELRVGGNLTAWTSDAQNFAPTGTHTTVLDGVGAQAVYLQNSGVAESRFQNIEVDNAAGASLNSTTRVNGNLVMTLGTLGGLQTVFLGGDLTEAVGGNQYQVLNTVVSGSPTLPASLQTNLTVTGAYPLAQGLAVTGNVTVDGAGATLNIGANTVSVSGDLRTSNGGTLTMQNAAGVLDVEGETEFNGGSTLGLLTDGELRLAGNFTAWTSDTENFAPTGAHLTTLDGTSAQTVYMYYSGVGQARFESLSVSNAVGVTLLGTTRIIDALTVSTALTVDLGQTTLVSGLFTLEAPATLTNNGSLQANSCSLLGTVVGNAPICP